MDDEEIEDGDFYSDEESFEFEFEDDENEDANEDNDVIEEDEDIALQNKYYSAKNLKDENPLGAIKELKSLIDGVEQNTENIDWVFKSYKQLIKINYNLGNYEESLQYLQNVIPVLGLVKRDYAEDSLNKMINNYSASKNTKFVLSVYEVILNYLQNSEVSSISTDRLWLKININRLNSLLDSGLFDQCPDLLKSINEKLNKVNENTKNSYSLEVIAAEIEYESHKEIGNFNTLSRLYRRSLDITTAVTHPRILATIKECGAKVQFFRGNYEKARLEFYDSFKNYDVAGLPKKNRILKYVALCSLLTESEFNPFESQETRTYAKLAEYSNLLLLIKAYDELNIEKFDQTTDKINTENDPLSDDEVFKHALFQISVNLKQKLILKYVQAYKTIRFEYLTRKLRINIEELEDLLLKLMNDGKFGDMRVDFEDNFIEWVGVRKKLFTPFIQTKDIYANLKALYLLKFDFTLKDFKQSSNESDGMEIDKVSESNEGDFASEFLNLSDYPQLNVTEVIEIWYTYMYSSIPNIVKSETSLLSKLRSENKSISVAKVEENNNNDNDMAALNTRAGILNSTVGSDAHEHEKADDDDDDDILTKADILAGLCNELKKHHEKITAH